MRTEIKTIILDLFLVHLNSISIVISTNKQKYVNTPPKTPFGLNLSISPHPHNSDLEASNCANLYLQIKGTENSSEQQG